MLGLFLCLQMEKKYEPLFFDLDRTLWNFDENSTKVLIDIFAHFKLEKSIHSVSSFRLKYQEINESLWIIYSENK